MSLFSIVQGRIPPPQPAVDPMAQPPMAAPSPAPQTHTMPDGTQMAGPPMAAPAPMAPTPGFVNGGMIPGYRWGDDEPTPTAPPADGGGAYTDIEGVMAQIWAEDAANPNIDQTGANYTNNLRLRAQQYLSERDYDRAQDAARGGGGAGPDHFYEQMAFEAAEAEKERRDARQMANVTQQSEAEIAQQAYKKALIDADTDRKTVASNALTGAQDFYAKMLSQGDPNQGAQWVAPQQAYETTMKTQGPTWDAPNMPGTVFPENWG